MISKEESEINLIDYIERIFNTVNDKIDGLLDCSVKDFVLLNKNFQKQHSLLDSLDNATNSFFKFSQSIVQEINQTVSPNQINKHTESIKNKLKNHLAALKGRNEKYALLGLLTSNLKQDLSTLQLLFTNLRFDPEISINPDKVESCFSHLDDCIKRTEQSINYAHQSLIVLINFIEEGLFTGIENYLELSSGIRTNLRVTLNSETELSKFTEQLKVIKQDKIASTSEIITNLQFQDILRQKIEHIISAHKHITQNLFNTKQKTESLSTEQLVMVRDISSLQSAQLVHANQEYQAAVETILTRFALLNKIQTKYNTIWNHFCKTEISRYATLIEALHEDLSLLNTQIISIDQLFTRLRGIIGDFSKDFESFLKETVSDKFNCNEILELEDLFSNKPVSKGEKKYSVSEQLRTELKKFQSGFSKFNSVVSELRKEDIIKNSLDLIPSEINDFLSQSSSFVSDSEKLISKLKEYKNIHIPDNNKSKTTPGIEQVAYYKSFEIEAKEIINLHDALLKRINVNNVKMDTDSLGDLRDLYTMQSERNVHDKLISKKKSSKPDENNDNEVEFF